MQIKLKPIKAPMNNPKKKSKLGSNEIPILLFITLPIFIIYYSY